MLLRLTTTRVSRLYKGGKHIDEVTGVAHPDHSFCPEDWLGSVTAAVNPGREVTGEGLSRVESGAYLKDVIAADPGGMLGAHQEMALLFKMLDAADRLAIQVHPTVPFAKEYFHSPFGKTECWYFLNDGGSVYLGFRPGITRERWIELFQTQDVEGMLSCLHRFEVKAGDMIFVEGGVPHAIGAGCFLAELQEPSDLVVLTERVTPSGNPVPETRLHGGLGYERMFDVFCYEGLEREEIRTRYFLQPQPMEEGRALLVGPDITDKFRLERMDVEGRRQFATADYGIVLVIGGSGTINKAAARTGDRFFVPACEKELLCAGEMQLLFCTAAAKV